MIWGLMMDEFLNENWTNYAIVKQVPTIESISTCYGDILFSDVEMEALKAFLKDLLEKRFESDK